MNKTIIYVLTQHTVDIFNQYMMRDIGISINDKAKDYDVYNDIYTYALKKYSNESNQSGTFMGGFTDEKSAVFALSQCDIEFSQEYNGYFSVTFFELNQYVIDTEYYRELIDDGCTIQEILAECDFLDGHSGSVIDKTKYK